MSFLSRVTAPLRDMISRSKGSFFGGSSLGLRVEEDAPSKARPKPSFGMGAVGLNKIGRRQQQETPHATPAKTKKIQVAPSPSPTSSRDEDERRGGEQEVSRAAVMEGWRKIKVSVFNNGPSETGSDKFAKLALQTMELDLVNNAPPNVLKIGGRSIHKNVLLTDLREKGARFDKLDKLGTGRVRLDKVAKIAGGEADTKQVFGNKKLADRMKNRKASLTETQDDGTIDIQDFLRLHYPEARDKDIDIMVKVVRELRGEKMYSRQYPKRHQRAAAKQWETVSKGKGSADIDALEDFLLEYVPDGDHYSLLKQLNTSLNDLYEESAEIQKEEFMFWFLTHLESDGTKDQDITEDLFSSWPQGPPWAVSLMVQCDERRAVPWREQRGKRRSWKMTAGHQ